MENRNPALDVVFQLSGFVRPKGIYLCQIFSKRLDQISLLRCCSVRCSGADSFDHESRYFDNAMATAFDATKNFLEFPLYSFFFSTLKS